MGIRAHNQSIPQTERRLPSGAECFPSSIDSQIKNQIPKRGLARRSPASQKPELCPQPGQKNKSTPVAIAHRFDRWGRNPDGQKTA